MTRSKLAILATALLALPSWAASASGQVPPGYVVSERPGPEGTPTRIELGLYLLDLSAVDDLRQDFSVDLYITAEWQDTRLAHAEPEGGSSERMVALAEVWNPAVGALNRRDVTLLLPQTVRVDSGGNVVYAQRIQGQFASPLDLREFPADQQTLTIRLASYRYGPEEVEIEINRNKTGRLDALSVAGWDVGQPEVEAVPLTVPGGIARAGAAYRLEANRQTTYYFLTMVIPLLLIALMAWAVFWIDPSFLPSQIGISTASIFSLIAFRLSLKSSLPKVAYLTQADWFVLAITILVFAAFGEAVLTGSLFKAGREVLARKVDRWARWLYVAALAVVLVVLG